MRLPRGDEPASRRWSLRDRPPYIEAYPTFSAGEVRRVLLERRDHLLWRDHTGLVLGAARLRWEQRDELVVRYQVDERSFLDEAHGELTLPITWMGSQENNQRPFTPCPVCARMADVLVFIGVWCCASIHHGVRHRSAVLRKAVRWSEEAEAIAAEVEHERRVGGTGVKHARRVARYANYARALVAGDPLEAWHAEPVFRDKAAGAKRQGTGIFSPKEKSAWEMTHQLFATVAQANGQTVERRIKVKETTLDQAEWEQLLLRMMGEQEDRCALTGLPFAYPGEGDDLQMRPSLDRIDSNGHYTPNNVQIVVRFINRWKGADADSLARRLIAALHQRGR